MSISAILQFFRDNPSAAILIGPVLAALGVIARWLYHQCQNHKYRGNDFPFQVIKPYNQVVSAVMDGDTTNDPLPPSSILYQPRAENTDVQRELETLLEDKHWLLITGKTGWGKTREAAELAQRLNQRGWTVLSLKHTELVNEPANFQYEKIGTDKKLLFLLDDLTNKMSRGKTESVVLAADPKQQLQTALQDRLFRMLERYKQLIGDEQEMRVIATARSETERENPNEPSEWEKLEWDFYPKFWNKFERYNLNPPGVEAQFHVLKSTVQQANIESALSDDEYKRLAATNDKTFRNLIQNLRNAKSEKRAFTVVGFEASLKGTWEKQFRDTIKKYPAACYVYDAVELLRRVEVELYRFTVEPTARLIVDGNFLFRFQLWLAIRRAMPYLIQANILNPSDGQIEAKGTQVQVEKYLVSKSVLGPLPKLILKLSDRYGAHMLPSLRGLGDVLYLAMETEQAEAMWRKEKELESPDVTYRQIATVLGDAAKAFGLTLILIYVLVSIFNPEIDIAGSLQANFSVIAQWLGIPR